MKSYEDSLLLDFYCNYRNTFNYARKEILEKSVQK